MTLRRRRFVPVPFDALECCDSDRERACVTDLYEQGKRRRWRPLRETERALAERHDLSRRELRALLDRLQAEDLVQVEVVMSGRRREGSTIIVHDPWPPIPDHDADHDDTDGDDVGEEERTTVRTTVRTIHYRSDHGPYDHCLPPTPREDAGGEPPGLEWVCEVLESPNGRWGPPASPRTWELAARGEPALAERLFDLAREHELVPRGVRRARHLEPALVEAARRRHGASP